MTRTARASLHYKTFLTERETALAQCYRQYALRDAREDDYGKVDV